VGEDLWDAYERMGPSFQQHAAGSAYNAHYDRPAVLAALGPVTGRQVLDAACGPGLYAGELLRRGAEVAAFDASPVMVRLARQRTAGRARIDRAALGGPLPYPGGAFDLIVCALAIHYASDRAAAFAEFCRVLRPGGAAVVSTQHPVMDWLRKGGSYFQATLETDIWPTPSGDQPVHCWREPLSALCTAAADAGFLIEKTHRAGPRRNHARTLSRGLREAEQGTRFSDPAPSQTSQAKPRPCELTGAAFASRAGWATPAGSRIGAVGARPRSARPTVAG
jgi:SAM-dependent methyltransferase